MWRLPEILFLEHSCTRKEGVLAGRVPNNAERENKILLKYENEIISMFRAKPCTFDNFDIFFWLGRKQGFCVLQNPWSKIKKFKKRSLNSSFLIFDLVIIARSKIKKCF